MSINHFFNKIKGKTGIDNTTLMCFFVVILVGLSSFGLGQLSVKNNDNNKTKNTDIIFVKEEIGEGVLLKDNSATISKERMYVASKNGKLYYGATCSGAKRISPKNEMWFSSSIDAEKAGYTLSSSCK